MYRLLGAIARANRWLNTVEVHGLPLDVGLVIFLPLVSLFAWALAVTEGSLAAWSILTVSLLTDLALLQCRLHHGVVFQRTPELAFLEDGGVAEPGVIPDFLASGRFVLWEGDRTRWERVVDRLLSGTRGDRWFLEVPATFVIQDEDQFSIAAFLDPSRRFLGIRLEKRAGLWTIDGEFGSLERIELGVLHLGFRTRLAIRLRFRNPSGRWRKAVLTFDDEGERQWFASAMRSAARSHWPGVY
jgi:hypothetical protein